MGKSKGKMEMWDMKIEFFCEILSQMITSLHKANSKQLAFLKTELGMFSWVEKTKRYFEGFVLICYPDKVFQ